MSSGILWPGSGDVVTALAESAASLAAAPERFVRAADKPALVAYVHPLHTLRCMCDLHSHC